MRGIRVLRPAIFFARLLGFRGNPLRRKWDRIEGMVLATAIAAALIAVPLAIWVGTAVYDQGLREVQAQMANRQQGAAVLLADAPARGLGISRALVTSTYRVPARWRTPDGAQRSGPIQVSAAAKAGSRIPVWLDQAGQAVDAPGTPTLAAGRAVFAGIGMQLGVVVSLFAVFRIVRWRLDRRRLSWWDAEWARIAPQWTTRRN